MAVARGWGWGNGDRVSILQDEENLGTDAGDGYATTGVQLIPLRTHVKTVKVINFTLQVFCHNKKEFGRKKKTMTLPPPPLLELPLR